MLHLKLTLMIFFNPMDVFYAIKEYRSRMNSILSIFLYAIALFSQYIYILSVHYPMTKMRPIDTNLVLEFVKLVFPVIVWVISSYAITSIVDGESKFVDIFNVGALCMMPLIVIKPILGIVSNIMSLEESGVFNLFQTFLILWVIILLFLALMKMNDYTFSKAIGTTILSIIGMLIICAIGLLIYALTSQLVIFFNDLIKEIRMAGLI